MRLETAWTFRAAWLLVAVLAGPLCADALAGRSNPVQTVASVGLWAGWLVVLVASLVPRVPSLTVLRVLVPAGFAAGVWAALQDPVDGPTAVLGLAVLGTATVIAFLPALGERFVDGSSYGPERRLTLRAPTVLMAGPIPLAWAVAVAGLAAGPLLLAAEQWVAGGVTLLIGVPLAAAALRSLHTLARRWVVFVPGGLVVHDPLTVAEAVLMPRPMIERLGPAPVDTTGLDLTLRAPGLVLEARLREALPVSVLRPLSRTVDSIETDAVLFTPRRPAAVLETAADHRLPAQPL